MNLSKKTWNFGAILIDIAIFIVSIASIYLKEFLKLVQPRKPKSLRGEVILITGSAGGLGQEICKKLATSGAKLVLWDVCPDANSRVAHTLRSLGAFVIDDYVDITSLEQVSTAAHRLRKSVGPVTILVNNAGLAPVANFSDLSPSSIEKTFQVNVLAQFNTIQAFLPEMIQLKTGHIVTIASTMSFMPMRGSAPYLASKHAIHGMIECLKDELANISCDFIKFSTIYPFFIKTNLLKDSTEKGFKLTFNYPSITPWLDVEQVASKVVDAILYEKEFVYLPKLTALFHHINPYMPTKVTQQMINFFVEELNIPQSQEKGEISPASCETIEEASQDALVGKNTKSFVDTIEKKQERIEL